MVLKEMPLIEAEKMVSQGEFIDGTSVDAFYRLQLYLKSL